MSRYDDLLHLKAECEERRDAQERESVAQLAELTTRLRDFLGWPAEMWERVPLDASDASHASDASANGVKQLGSGMILTEGGWVAARIAARGPVGTVMDLRLKTEGEVTHVAVGDIEAVLRRGEPGDVELFFRRVFERLKANVRSTYGPAT